MSTTTVDSISSNSQEKSNSENIPDSKITTVDQTKKNVELDKPKVPRFFPFDDPYKACYWMMNFEIDKARELLDKTKSFCPVSMLLYGETYNVSSWASQNRSEKEKTIEIVIQAEALAQSYIDNDKKLFEYIKKRCNVTQITKRDLMNWKTYMKIITGDALLSRAINQLQINQYVRAAWNMGTCWKIYSGLLKESVDKEGKSIFHPEIVEHLHFGVGLFYYIVSLVPGVVQKILTAIGFVSDQDKAIDYMTEIYKGGGLKSPYAATILLGIYLFLPSALSDMHENLKNAKPIIEFCQKTYPNGAMFNYLCAQYYRKIGEGKEAVDALRLSVKASQAVGVEPNLFLWDLANCHLMCLEWKEAIEQLEFIIQRTGQKRAFEFNSICTLQLACAYSMVGDQTKATENLKKVKQFVSNKGRFDKMALRKAEGIMVSQDPVSAMTSACFEILYFKRDIAHMKKEHLEKVDIYIGKICHLDFDPQKDLKKTKPEDVLNFASNLVIAGAVQNLLGNKEKARYLWGKVLQSEPGMPTNGKHWIVGALYEFAEMSFREGNLEISQDYIVKACKYSNYDWEDVYKSRLHKARSQLKKALTNKGLKVVEKIEVEQVDNKEEEDQESGGSTDSPIAEKTDRK